MTMNPDPSDTFTIQFEEDLSSITPTECNTRSRIYLPWKSRKTETQLEVAEELDDILTEREIKDSYMSATLSTVQPLDSHHALLILQIACHPCPGRRFVNATIDLRVAPQPPSTSGSRSSFDLSPNPSPNSSPKHNSLPLPRPHGHPKVVELAPQHSVGGRTEEQTRFKQGIALPIAATFGPASVGITPSVEREIQKVVIHAMNIVGSIQKNMKCAHWTVEENRSSGRGIPTHFQVALVVEHNGPFVVKFQVEAKLGGGLWPRHMVSKDRGGKGLQKTIDVETWRRGEVELAPGETAWRAFLAEFTGEVPGLMREFGQSVVRP